MPPRLPRLPIGSPLQLLLSACSFALAAYAGVRLLADDWFGVALWFVGAALLHDLVLLPCTRSRTGRSYGGSARSGDRSGCRTYAYRRPSPGYSSWCGSR